MTKKALILSGDGLNCENETAIAFIKAGTPSDIIHINELISNPTLLRKYHTFVLPGGFSFGDEINSGSILALKMKSYLEKELHNFIQDKKTILGICNGFQVLIKLGLFYERKKVMTLTSNSSHKFINKWEKHIVNKNTNSIWLKDLEIIDMPIRHGEGRLLFFNENEEDIYKSLDKSGQIALFYESNINGSYKRIAGLSDKTGQILGLMPHPEAAIDHDTYIFKDSYISKSFNAQKFFKNNHKYINTL